VNVVILRWKRMDSRHCRLMTASLAPVNPSNRREVTGSMQGVICPMIRLSEELRVFVFGHFIPQDGQYLPLLCPLQGNLAQVGSTPIYRSPTGPAARGARRAGPNLSMFANSHQSV
jgi:hypothetical protein